MTDLPAVSHWNYRIFQTPDGQCYIGEAYYDKDDNKVTGWTNGVAPHGDTPDEVKADVLNMTKAIGLPILKTEDL